MKEKQTTEQRVYNNLKEALLARKIAPGTQLVEQTISETLKVSRTPIRQAFQKLEAEGLIEIIPNKGSYVVHPTKDEILSFFDMRREFEHMAVKYGLDKLEAADIENLKSLLEKEQETYKSKDLNGYVHLNKEFHLYLARKSGNRFLIRYMEQLLNQNNVYLFLFDVFYQVETEHNARAAEHEKMVQAMEDKNAEDLHILIDQHMKRSINDLRLEDEVFKPLSKILSAEK
ncbi:GntR family transcriptional regulator [Metabacillus sp. KIGAM252]|uniref:GntR family transcriptional regulator n=1 Tax=Metabacillus flavus TaxID=2823519 RepID=A0ABS5LJQ6_9BACI|nr:GntR family transcriptional regulator [Metabacillus flavus]MBS2970963.1 GntR family transcriptional regulator [Metabacillus flavus]